MGSIVTHTNLFGRNPIDAIRNAGGRPVYIVHSKADTRIDVNQSEQLAAAAQAAGVNVTTWFPENGEHVQTPAVYPEEFEQRVVELLPDGPWGSPARPQWRILWTSKCFLVVLGAGFLLLAVALGQSPARAGTDAAEIEPNNTCQTAAELRRRRLCPSR